MSEPLLTEAQTSKGWTKGQRITMIGVGIVLVIFGIIALTKRDKTKDMDNWGAAGVGSLSVGVMLGIVGVFNLSGDSDESTDSGSIANATVGLQAAQGNCVIL